MSDVRAAAARAETPGVIINLPVAPEIAMGPPGA